MEFLTSLHGLGDWGLVALRIAIGAIFWVHGTQKKAMWKIPATPPQSGAEAGKQPAMPKNMLYIMRILSVAEPLGALAMFAGFLTQLAALGFCIIMLGALNLKINKWKAPFTARDVLGWEFDLMILSGCIALVLLGGGNFALDRLVFGL